MSLAKVVDKARKRKRKGAGKRNWDKKTIKRDFELLNTINKPHGVLGFWGFGVLGLGFRV